MINYITLYTILHIGYIMASTPTRTSRQYSAPGAAPGAPTRNKDIGTAGGTEAGPPSLKPSSVHLKF